MICFTPVQLQAVHQVVHQAVHQAVYSNLFHQRKQEECETVDQYPRVELGQQLQE